jgi:hypothetical protein
MVEKFNNPISGETLIHRDRPDGKKDLFWGPTGKSEHGHAVIKPNGNPSFIRDTDGRVIADDKFKP